MECPYIRVEESGATIPLLQDVTTVGRGRFVDVQLADPSVSMLHAEMVRRGPYVYVTDLGLSRNGTRVNGRLVARRLLADADVLTFGSARCRMGGIAGEELSADTELRRAATPELTRRELAAVKQHLLRLYQKFRIPEGPNRRVRLANEVVALGLVRPMPQSALPERIRPVPAKAVPAQAAQAVPAQAVPAQAVPAQASPSGAVPAQAV